MDHSINYLSVENLAWVHCKKELTSFGHHSLPPDVHFTISYDKRSGDINFHLTRNVSNKESKPKIGIACINKELFNKLQEPIAQAVLGQLFLPLDITFLRRKYGRRLHYLSFSDMEQDKRRGDIEANITNGFKKISSIKRKSRLKISSPNESILTSIFLTAKMRNLLLDNLKILPRQFSTTTTDTGFLLAGKTIVPFIRVGQDWYRINDRCNPIDLLLAWIDVPTRRELRAKFEESISFIKTAKTYKDTEPYDIPICLVELSPQQTDFV